MPNRRLKDAEYEIVVSFIDNGEGNCIANSIVEEGETPVNTYRLTVGKNHPVTQIPFNKNEDALMAYALENPEHLWQDYWEDPEPEESE